MSLGGADILLRYPSGEVVAAVDVKNPSRLSMTDAIEFREALRGMNLPTEDARYLLLISQKFGYIWRGGSNGEQLQRPEQFDMTPILKQYLTDAELQQQLRGAELEIAIAHWLAQLSRGERTATFGSIGTGILADFVADARGAEIELEALI
jgi:hypothetical protein